MGFVKPRLLSASESFWTHYRSWARRVQVWCNGSLGYVEGELYHLFHGDLVNRDYDGRLKRIHGFDPTTDTEVNLSTGLLEWSRFARQNKMEMIASVLEYFYKRSEDTSIT